jgi:hypothetical protein
MPQTVFHGSRQALEEVLRGLPALLAGKVHDPSGAVRELLGAMGLEALTMIQEAYLTKARGGTDDAGITWKPLKPETIAYGRRHPGLARKRRAASQKGRAGRPLLSEAQDKLWRETYSRALARFTRAGEADAKGHAAALAWRVTKAAGGQTILDKYGQEKVEIGRDTGVLLNSLAPGSAPGPSSAKQIFRIQAGAVVVGTNVPYAEHFHRVRPIWPDVAQVPAAWWQRLSQVLAKGLVKLLEGKLR